MLIIKAPIQLKSNIAMIPSQEAFYHRITDNYELFSSQITGEDLLHIVTEPPQIYFGEGNMTSIVQSTHIQNSQENKLEIINNLLNRIVMNSDVQLTYQDRVYITDVLHKLGVQNVQQFMQQVNRLKQETNNLEEQVSFYWSNMENLTHIVQENDYRENLTEQTVNQQNVSQKYLHEEIMNRLQTGAIYQILNNFYADYNGNSYHVNAHELQITEQKRTATNILLNQLQNFTGSDEIPFVFHHDNYYESMYMDEQNLTQDAVNNRITSAILLNLIDNLYLNRFEKKLQNKDIWVNMGDSLYQTAENTLKRVYNYLENPQHKYFPVHFSEVSMRYPSREKEEEETADYIKNQITKITETEIYNTQHNIENQYINQEIAETDNSEESGEAKTENVQVTEEMLRIVSNYIDNSQTYVNDSESTETTTMQLMEGEVESEDKIDVYRETVPDYMKELTRINQQNIENYNRYQKMILEQQKEGNENRKQEAPEVRMRRESLIALHNPEQLFEEYQEEAKNQETQKNVQLQELTKMIPEQTRKIYEQLEEYRMRTISQPGNTIRNDIGALMQDIRMVENQERIHEKQSLIYTDKARELSEIVQTKQQQTEIYLQQSRLGKESAIQSEAPLIHKTRDSHLDEEVIEQLLEQNRMLKNNISLTERVEEDKQITNTKVVHQVQQNVIHETQDISDIVQKSMQRQIGSISDQVYSKLEKRLQNEKKRRGY